MEIVSSCKNSKDNKMFINLKTKDDVDSQVMMSKSREMTR